MVNRILMSILAITATIFYKVDICEKSQTLVVTFTVLITKFYSNSNGYVLINNRIN